MENGKVEIYSWTRPNLAAHVIKPITYFSPAYNLQQITPDNLTPLEQELRIHYRNVWDEHLQKVAIDIIRVLAQSDPEEMLVDSIEAIAEKLEIEEELSKIFERKKRAGNK